MADQYFASIVIGSTQTEMKVFELNSRRGMKEIDCVNSRINLGVDAYSVGQLAVEKVEELCRLLKDFRRIMDGYHVDAYRLCATSAMREIRSSLITKDYIEKQTGLKIEILSNSEQRFLDYKSLASESTAFEEIVQSGTAIVDIGGNSIQISVFDKNRLITTQNIHMGKVSTWEHYLPMAETNRHFEQMMIELMEHELNEFGKLYQKDREIRNLILLDADLCKLWKKKSADGGALSEVISREDFLSVYRQVVAMHPNEITTQFEIAADTASFVSTSAIFCRCLMEKLGAQVIYLADLSIGDGLCYDYAVTNKFIRSNHSFDDDIIAECRSIAKRYKSSQAHIKNMEDLSLQIFDRMKKIHGLGARERLLLQVAVILHNCGKYISLSNVAECAYNIIMATEIVGISDSERLIIANVVKFNTLDFVYFNELSQTSSISREEYLVVAKLTAILKVANSLDRSHRQKCKNAVITLQGDRLVISVESDEDLTLEKGTLAERAALFFEEVFSVHPVIKQKKRR